jgi:tRNA(Ile)-lysidine synthase
VKEDLLSFVRRHELIEPEDRVLVAFSGGADSTCLLHLLVQAGFNVAAAHLHHSQRPEGDDDVEHCRSFCEFRGIAFYVGKADVPAVAKSQKIGLEEAGRKLRYEFLRMVAQQGFEKIATGHTQNDTVETLLLNLARGSGMRGLAGIPPRRDNIIRPILFMKRAETHAYCQENGLRYVQDSYNEDHSFARNLVRAKVVPMLENINPQTVSHIGRTADILAEEDRILDALAGAHLAANEIGPQGPLAFIESRIWAKWRPLTDLPLAVLRRAIRIAAAMFGGTLDYESTQALAHAIRSLSKASFTCEGEPVVLLSSEESWSVQRKDKVQPFRQILTIPGETIADDLGWALASWHGRPSDRSPLTGVLDPSKVKGELYARSIKTGDKIDPPGRGDKKPLSQRLSRAGLSEGVRQRLPVVCDLVGPVWAPLVGPDRRVAAGENQEQTLILSLGPINDPSGNAEAV